MSQIEEVLLNSSALLREKNIVNASLDARILMEFILDISHEELIKIKKNQIDEEQLEQYKKLVDRRCKKEPIAKIIGKKPFWKYDFYTNSHTLDPRPDSESLIELVLEYLSEDNDMNRGVMVENKSTKILDIGTGTGCLLLSLIKEINNSTGIGVDISKEAIKIAEKNARELNIFDRVSFIESDLDERLSGEFDIIVSNPPYIPEDEISNLEDDVKLYDPMSALVGGKDGYDFYRKIASFVGEFLSRNGIVVFEIGIGQEDKIEAIMAQHGMYLHEKRRDISGIVRALMFKI